MHAGRAGGGVPGIFGVQDTVSDGARPRWRSVGATRRPPAGKSEGGMGPPLLTSRRLGPPAEMVVPVTVFLADEVGGGCWRGLPQMSEHAEVKHALAVRQGVYTDDHASFFRLYAGALLSEHTTTLALPLPRNANRSALCHNLVPACLQHADRRWPPMRWCDHAAGL